MLNQMEISESFGSVSALSGTRYKVRLIEGNRLGSSAYYPEDVLRNDGPLVFKKGTPMFLNHQTPDEKQLRPFGSIHDYAGELAEDAYYENDGLYAEVEVFEDMAPIIKARKDKIGISIRANVVAEEGDIAGKRVPVVKQIVEAKSADFVMRAGAGGRIVSILESAVEETPQGVEENGDNMDAVLDAIKALDEKFEGRFKTIEEQLASVEEKAVETDPIAEALEIAEAFVGSTLDAEGRARVLDLHRANGKPVVELIAAEEAYVKSLAEKTVETEGVEESADETVEVEESAKITVPTIGAWKKD